jgi:GntR family transcriptional regulator, rspAB operon transcriptional repressor
MAELLELPNLPLNELLAPEDLEGPGNTTNKVYAVLRRLIIEVRLLPGRALSEKEVAAVLHVSKTPGAGGDHPACGGGASDGRAQGWHLRLAH